MEQLKHQEINYDGVHCRLTLKNLSANVIVIEISGSDVGEFGEVPMLALTKWFAETALVDLFIDARDARGASVGVSGEWAQWLGRHRAKLQSVTMLTGSRLIQITAEFVRRFADLEGIMWICTEPDVFDKALSEALETR